MSDSTSLANPTVASSSSSSSMTMSSELPMAPNMTVRPQPPTISAPGNTSANSGGIGKKRGQQKDTAANKANKPGVRAKSGCYTCRIRRKKCDEQPNEHGACETCVRLRLQCLGFGAKRPEWLRSPANVQELRNRIKDFLASQGMIKGHANGNRPGPDLGISLPGPTDQQLPQVGFDMTQNQPPPALLSLEDPVAPRTAGSPPVPPLNPAESVVSTDSHPPSPPSNGEGVNYRTIQTSSIRETSTPTTGVLDPALASATTGPSRNTGSPLNPAEESLGYFTTYTNIVPSSSSSSNVLVGPSFIGADGVLQLVAPQLAPQRLSYDALASSGTVVDHLFDQLFTLDEDSHDSTQVSYTSRQQISIPMHLPQSTSDGLIHFYFESVIHCQYILSDQVTIRRVLQPIIYGDANVKAAARLLSSISYYQVSNPKARLEHARGELDNLAISITLSGIYESRARAMVALFAISIFLFLGGKCGGPTSASHTHCLCSSGIQAIRQYADQILGPDPEMVRERFSDCDDLDRWIFLTGIWFDTIRSVTSGETPMLETLTDAVCGGSDAASPSSTVVMEIPTSDSYVENSAPLPNNSYSSPLHLVPEVEESLGSANLDLVSSFNTQQNFDSSLIPAAYYFSSTASSQAQALAHAPDQPESSSAVAHAWQHPGARQQGLPSSHSTPHYATYANFKSSLVVPQPKFTMLDGMGASPSVVRLICRIQSLHSQKKKRHISDREFYRQGEELLTSLERMVALEEPESVSFQNDLGDGAQFSASRNLQVAQEMAAKVWKSTAELYYHSVLEDDCFDTAEIKKAVENTMNNLRWVWGAHPASVDGGGLRNESSHRSSLDTASLPIIRNLYFPTFLCGVLTSDSNIRQEIVKILRAQIQDSPPQGNASSVLDLLEGIWKKYHNLYYFSPPLTTIPWRQDLKDSHLLLI